MRKLGWGTSLNYEGDPIKKYDRYQRLLDEMAGEHLNYLSIFMIHWGYNYAESVGAAWPVQEPRFAHFTDPQCVNANPETEFLPRLVTEAHARGIEVDLAFSQHGGNMMPMLPDAGQTDREGTVQPIPCPAYEGFAELNAALAGDMLNRYGRAELGDACVDGYYGEGPTFHQPWFYSRRSKERFLEQYGKDLGSVPELEQWKWAQELVRDHLRTICSTIERINPNLRRGQHCWEVSEVNKRGHGPHVYVAAGIQHAIPGWHSLDPAEMRARMDLHAERMPSTVHISCRAKPPMNYAVPGVGPEDIAMTAREMISYIRSRSYPEDHIGVIYFSAENVVPENRKAVYAALRSIRSECG